jgi:SAM-dependent methyltransferase
MDLHRLKRFARDWNSLGRQNAYGAILTSGSGVLSAWDPDAFFATGQADVARFIADLSRIAPDVSRRRALDFGCGVGRITRSLSPHFESVVGVDVAPAMIAQARALNAAFPNCRFLLNRESHLGMFPQGSFDVVYSRLVLQHVPARLIDFYIRELIRVLAPGGVLMFQLPEHIEPAIRQFLKAPVAPGTLKQHAPLFLVRAYRLVKYLYFLSTSGPRMTMSGLPFEQVTELIRRSDGQLLATVADMSHGMPGVRGFEYWARKRSRI